MPQTPLEGSCVLGLEYRHKFVTDQCAQIISGFGTACVFWGPVLSGPRQSRTHAKSVGP